MFKGGGFSDVSQLGCGLNHGVVVAWNVSGVVGRYREGEDRWWRLF